MSGPAGRAPAGPEGGRGNQDRHARRDRDAQDNPGWTIFAYLLSGMAVYGGIGWLAGRWVGNQPVCLAVGMVVGLALAIALIVFRYGRA
jgi:ATP synthase protein I